MKTLILAALLCALLALDTAQGQSCFSGWTRNNGRCFMHVPKALTWPAAQLNCQSLGGNLASVRDAEEYEVIQKVIADAKGTGLIWIGGHDLIQEGKWKWTDKTPFTYTNWAPGQPDDYQRNEDCLQISTEGRRFWNDLDCQTPLPSVCVKKLW
ncbi:ladderlectin-like [Mastacembelus armatus]|uniref:ladderlectin-like n=1 Tax=Mastacembelus armatus TaxID=205130 RepID=UPI000E45E5A6|nr:ladderlectin-like [Mastacembelus armatus]